MRVHVWNTAGFRRVLFTSDVLANSTTLFFLAFGMLRLSANLPAQQPSGGGLRDVTLGPKQAMFSLWAAVPAYLVTSVLPLLWLLRRTDSYFRHRTTIVTGIRVMRLAMAVMMMGSNSALAAISARIAVARALHSPSKALVILIVQPMAYYLHHILYLLPWWPGSLLFQLATAGALLHWFWRFPCFVEPTSGGGGVAGTPLPHAWQPRAQQACSNMQSYAALLRTALGGTPLSDFSQNLCADSSDALQVLQIFYTFVCLVLIPVTICLELERWMRLRYQQQLPARGGSSGSTSSGAASSRGISSITSTSSSSHSAGSSSSSALARNNRDGWGSSSGGGDGGSGINHQHHHQQHRSINTLSMHEMQRLTEEGDVGGDGAVGHAVTLVFAMLLVLPALWLLSEALAGLFAATRDCSAVLAAAH